jgi:hypothetical protein
MLLRLRRLSHEHKVEFILFMFTCLFDLSFGIEKLLAWAGIWLDPGYWAVWYLGLGALTTLVAYLNLKYDLDKDCGQSR